MAYQRLTQLLDDRQPVMDCQLCGLREHCGNCTALACRDRIKNRLATFEDIVERHNLDLSDLEHGAELAEKERDGRLVVLPCKVGVDVFTWRWSIKNQKYEVVAGKVKNVRYDATDGSVMVSNGEYYRLWGKDAFPSRQEAVAALDGGGKCE